MDKRTLILIAGSGRFPFMVAEGARAGRVRVIGLGLRGMADPGLRPLCDHWHWTGLARLGHWLRAASRYRADEVILAGSVRKADMYGRFRLIAFLPDWTSFKLWFFELRDKRNDAVLGAVAEAFRRRGIPMEPCVKYCAEHLSPPGLLTHRAPAPSHEADIAFGLPPAREIGRLDIGQAIAVKERDVIAVEAIEGTDRMIERAGALCPRGGWILIKLAKPNQDMRFDVPTVGPDTIRNLARHKAAGVVIEAGRTVLIDKEETVRLADTLGLFLLAVEPAADS